MTLVVKIGGAAGVATANMLDEVDSWFQEESELCCCMAAPT